MILAVCPDLMERQRRVINRSNPHSRIAPVAVECFVSFRAGVVLLPLLLLLSWLMAPVAAVWRWLETEALYGIALPLFLVAAVVV